MEPNPTWELWAAWLGNEPKPGTIYKDVVDMMAARQLWEGFNAVVGEAPENAKRYGTFHSWFNTSYVESQGLAIRRQVEVRDDVVSLGRLLDRIAKAPSVLSRERYLARLHPDEDQRLGNKFFDSLTSPGAEAIDPSIPLADLERLRSGTAKIKTWIDKEVAHYDPEVGRFSEGLTFGDVHGAIDLVFKVLNRYMQLIIGTTISGSVLMPRWEAIFRVAWLPDENAWRRVVEAARENDQRRMGA